MVCGVYICSIQIGSGGVTHTYSSLLYYSLFCGLENRGRSKFKNERFQVCFSMMEVKFFRQFGNVIIFLM